MRGGIRGGRLSSRCHQELLRTCVRCSRGTWGAFGRHGKRPGGCSHDFLYRSLCDQVERDKLLCDRRHARRDQDHGAGAPLTTILGGLEK